MRWLTGRRSRHLSVLGVCALLVSLAGSTPYSAQSATIGAHDTTLRVYTCCGSLSGFNNQDPAALGSMHALYSTLWAQQFPGLHWQETAFDSQRTMIQRLAADVAAGISPDLVFIQGDYIGYAALRGLAQPLDRYFAAANLTVADFLPGMSRWARFGGHWWAIPAVSGPLGGQHIYLPKYTSPLGFNNRNLVTFDDYYRLSQKAVLFDSAGRLQRIGYWPGVNSWETIGTLMCQPGHGMYDAADRPTATDPCNTAYLVYLKKLSDLYGGYAKLAQFMAGDPDFLSGSSRSYFATGRAILPPSTVAYWNIPPLDSHGFGTSSGLNYQLTTIPVSPDGKLGEAANYPSTQQEVIVPPGAPHPALAFDVSKMMFWQNGYLLGRATGGSPVAGNSKLWLHQVIATEAATRKLSGLIGNPIAGLKGLQLQPQLGLISRASNPINPIDLFYNQELQNATVHVLLGKLSPSAALQHVQAAVLAQEKQLAAQYGPWNW